VPISGRFEGTRALLTARTSAGGSVRLKWAILALVSGQVRPRLAAWSRDKWHQRICNPLRAGKAGRFGNDGARAGGGGESRSLQPSVCLPFYFFFGAFPVPDSETDCGALVALSFGISVCNQTLSSKVPAERLVRT